MMLHHYLVELLPSCTLLRRGLHVDQLPLVDFPEDFDDPPLGIEIYEVRRCGEFRADHIAEHLHLLVISHLCG